MNLSTTEAIDSLNVQILQEMVKRKEKIDLLTNANFRWNDVYCETLRTLDSERERGKDLEKKLRRVEEDNLKLRVSIEKKQKEQKEQKVQEEQRAAKKKTKNLEEDEESDGLSMKKLVAAYNDVLNMCAGITHHLISLTENITAYKAKDEKKKKKAAEKKRELKKARKESLESRQLARDWQGRALQCRDLLFAEIRQFQNSQKRVLELEQKVEELSKKLAVDEDTAEGEIIVREFPGGNEDEENGQYDFPIVEDDEDGVIVEQKEQEQEENKENNDEAVEEKLKETVEQVAQEENIEKVAEELSENNLDQVEHNEQVEKEHDNDKNDEEKLEETFEKVEQETEDTSSNSSFEKFEDYEEEEW